MVFIYSRSIRNLCKLRCGFFGFSNTFSPAYCHYFFTVSNNFSICLRNSWTKSCIKKCSFLNRAPQMQGWVKKSINIFLKFYISIVSKYPLLIISVLSWLYQSSICYLHFLKGTKSKYCKPCICGTYRIVTVIHIL